MCQLRKMGITVNIDHGTYDKNCPVYEMEKTRVQNNTDIWLLKNH